MTALIQFFELSLSLGDSEFSPFTTTAEKPHEPVLTFTECISDLPLADALHSESKGPLQTSAELKGVTADLNDVVDERAHGSQREGRGEEHHVAKLDKHLLVVLESVLSGPKWTIKTQLYQVSTV